MRYDNSPAAVRRRADRVLACLGAGRGRAIIGRDLRTVTGLPDHELRKTLEHIRRGGQVVIADDAGYYLPETLPELRTYIQQEEHRSTNHQRTLESARQLAEQWEGDGM